MHYQMGVRKPCMNFFDPVYRKHIAAGWSWGDEKAVGVAVKVGFKVEQVNDQQRQSKVEQGEINKPEFERQLGTPSSRTSSPGIPPQATVWSNKRNRT